MPQTKPTERMADVLRRELVAIAQRLLRDRAIFMDLEEKYAFLDPYLDRDPDMTVAVGRALLKRRQATTH